MSSSAVTPASVPVRLVAFGVVATVLLFIAGALFAGTANAAADKVWVCKYVGTPGEDERLSSGKNPISVSVNATSGAGVGGFFNDAQGRSYVLAVVQGDDDDDDDDGPRCPRTPPGPTTPVVTETTPVVTETTPVVTETTPVVTETTPVVTETTPVVTETTPVVTETTPVVTETTPGVTDTTSATTSPELPGAAPTGLGSSQAVGIFSLFALAVTLLGAAGVLVRNGQH